jgi:hypothetical protein
MIRIRIRRRGRSFRRGRREQRERGRRRGGHERAQRRHRLASQRWTGITMAAGMITVIRSSISVGRILRRGDRLIVRQIEIVVHVCVRRGKGVFQRLERQRGRIPAFDSNITFRKWINICCKKQKPEWERRHNQNVQALHVHIIVVVAGIGNAAKPLQLHVQCVHGSQIRGHCRRRCRLLCFVDLCTGLASGRATIGVGRRRIDRNRRIVAMAATAAVGRAFKCGASTVL